MKKYSYGFWGAGYADGGLARYGQGVRAAGPGQIPFA